MATREHQPASNSIQTSRTDDELRQEPITAIAGIGPATADEFEVNTIDELLQTHPLELPEISVTSAVETFRNLLRAVTVSEDGEPDIREINVALAVALPAKGLTIFDDGLVKWNNAYDYTGNVVRGRSWQKFNNSPGGGKAFVTAVSGGIGHRGNRLQVVDHEIQDNHVELIREDGRSATVTKEYAWGILEVLVEKTGNQPETERGFASSGPHNIMVRVASNDNGDWIGVGVNARDELIYSD